MNRLQCSVIVFTSAGFNYSHLIKNLGSLTFFYLLSGRNELKMDKVFDTLVPRLFYLFLIRHTISTDSRKKKFLEQRLVSKIFCIVRVASFTTILENNRKTQKTHMKTLVTESFSYDRYSQ